MIDYENIEKLIKNPVESDEVDFKVKADEENEIRELVKDILAMSNNGGGYIIIGIEDKSGSIIGIDPATHNDLEVTKISQRVQKYTDERIMLETYIHEYSSKKLYIICVKGIDSYPHILNKNLDKSGGTQIAQAGTIFIRKHAASKNVTNTSDLRKIIDTCIEVKKEDFKRILSLINSNENTNSIKIDELNNYLKRYIESTTYTINFPTYEISCNLLLDKTKVSFETFYDYLKSSVFQSAGRHRLYYPIHNEMFDKIDRIGENKNIFSYYEKNNDDLLDLFYFTKDYNIGFIKNSDEKWFWQQYDDNTIYLRSIIINIILPLKYFQKVIVLINNQYNLKNINLSISLNNFDGYGLRHTNTVMPHNYYPKIASDFNKTYLINYNELKEFHNIILIDILSHCVPGYLSKYKQYITQTYEETIKDFNLSREEFPLKL